MGVVSAAQPSSGAATTTVDDSARTLPQAIESVPAELARFPQAVVKTVPQEIGPVETYLEAKLPLMEALPLPDLIYGGGVLVVVVVVQAIGVRLLTGHFDKRSEGIKQRPTLWRVDLLFGGAVFMMLALHLGSIVLWSAALVYGQIIPDWERAARFAALSYTTIGSDLTLPKEWHMLGPIIAISGMFTFAWTASVLVSIVDQCNHLRRSAWDALRARRAGVKHARPPTLPTAPTPPTPLTPPPVK
ncbi:conserved membrane hypothetical protein [Candidatus Accumulibacter aalborgensis]|uniref:Potassium channel domain-containing protein n=1 Tax=Candidatus Accumulibacter aalborgensis TaxID=1860102 RepID=A0A1A8XPK4_9PROT|nr:hypothetical protein [Candidatus Accumulibacter aalborgensis]SBT05868.1 conserved membrane hypothetical protein [Candidatus Accumulibacter aalborgensis]